MDAPIEDTKRSKPGKPGDCDLCGEWSGELVEDVCPPCREKYNIPCEKT